MFLFAYSSVRIYQQHTLVGNDGNFDNEPSYINPIRIRYNEQCNIPVYHFLCNFKKNQPLNNLYISIGRSLGRCNDFLTPGLKCPYCIHHLPKLSYCERNVLHSLIPWLWQIDSKGGRRYFFSNSLRSRWSFILRFPFQCFIARVSLHHLSVFALEGRRVSDKSMSDSQSSDSSFSLQ